MFATQRLLGASLGLMMAAGSPGAAQQRAPMYEDVVEHAEIGKLEWYDAGGQFIIVGIPMHALRHVQSEYRPLPVSRNYRIDEQTHVGGVDPMAAGTPRGLSGQDGGLVLVKYTYTGDRLYSPWIYYIGSGEMREAVGTIEWIDTSRNEMSVKNSTGVTETMELSTHGLVDSEAGLVKLIDLRAGEGVRVYYVSRSGNNVAYLIRDMTS